MSDVSTFGKKVLRASVPARPLRAPEAVDVSEPATDELSRLGIMEFLTETRVPFLGLALMALLAFVFCEEHVPGIGFSVTFGGKVTPLYAHGALSANAVYAGECSRHRCCTMG
jgi:hypothetical protein